MFPKWNSSDIELVWKKNKTKHTTGRQTIELFPSILFDFFTSFTLRNLLGSLIVSKIQMTLAKNQKEMRLCSLSLSS
jgi:hypothetical protein